MIDVAILGAAHSHVAYGIAEIAGRADARIVACAEADPAMREQFLGSLSVPCYDTAEELLARHAVDAVIVAGIYSERAAAVVAALGADAHVLADKPLCTSVDQLDAITAAAGRAGRHVSVMFEKRFSPVTLAVRRLIAEGELGELALIASTGPHKLNAASRPEWFWGAGYGGIAGDLPVHDVDLVLALSGASSGTVSAATGNAGAAGAEHPGFDDHVAMLLRAGTVTATIEANWLSPQAAPVHGRYRMRITGSRGTAELDWAYGTLEVATHDRDTYSPELPPGPGPAAYFFDALAGDREPEITTAASLLATRVALLAQRSADDAGRPESWTR